MKLTRSVRLFLLLLGCVGAWAALLFVREQYREPPNYAKIEKGLYLGGYVEAPPAGTTAVLNVGDWEDPYECEQHVWSKIPDRAPAPTLDWLAEQVTFISSQRKAGRTTYVHCMNGASRGPMVVCAYLMKEHGWTRDETLTFLRERRPQTRPNPAFMELLDEWERTQKRLGAR